MRKLMFLVFLCCSIPAFCQEQRQLPSWVDEAIKLGQTKNVEPYPIKFLMVRMGSFTTPYLRVAMAAAKAHKMLLKPFDTSMVTDEMLEDVLVVMAFPVMGKKMNDPHESVTHIVIKKKGSKDPKDVVQPLSEEPYGESASNLYGAKIEEQGIVAKFPLATLQEGSAFCFIYDRGKGRDLAITKDMIQQTMR